MKKLFYVGMTLFLLTSGSAFAASSGGSGACKADVEKYCPNVEKGQGRIKACLKENKANLSEGCKAEIAKRREKKKMK